MIKYLLLLCFLCGSSLLAARPGEISSHTFEEIKIALMDVRQELNRQRIEMELLQEKLQKVERAKQLKISEQQKMAFAELEAKVQAKMGKLEQLCQKMESDLQVFAGETTKSLSEYKEVMTTLEKTMGDQSERLDKLSQLKATLTAISKAIDIKKGLSTASYQVKGGDSLEKIARDHDTTVETLMTLNELKTTTIIKGQKLKVPDFAKGAESS